MAHFASIFLNEIYQLKWYWRVLFFFVLLFTTTNLVFSKLVAQFFIDTKDFQRDGYQLIIWIGLLIITFAYTWLSLKILDKRKFKSIGLAFHSEWKRELMFGLLLGAIFTLSLVFFLWIGQYVTIQTTSSDLMTAASGTILSITLWICVSLFSELIFRGYIMQTMSEGLGNIAATIFMSICYGVFQGLTSQGNILPVINTALFGFIFCIIYFRTRSLWIPVGHHFSYQFIQSYMLGAPVSGIVTTFSLFKTIEGTPEWITGGRYGLEGGGVATVLLLGLLYYVSQSKQLRITETMRKIKYEALTTPFYLPKAQQTEPSDLGDSSN